MHSTFQRALLLHQEGQLAQAAALYEEILRTEPAHLDALHLLGVLAAQTNNPLRAVELFDSAIALNPNSATFYFNRGLALQALEQPQAALASYDKCIALEHNAADAYFNRGNTLKELNRREAALASYDKAIAIRPDYAEAYYNRGNVLGELKQPEAALASYDKAIAVKPDYAEAFNNRGNALLALEQHQAAIENYDKALAIIPGYVFLCGMRLFCKMHICDWKNFDTQLAELTQKIQFNEKAATPFNIVALSASLPLQRKAAEIWVNTKYPKNISLGKITKYPGHAKIRIGYFSFDFRAHPVSFLTAELFETHDRNRFEVIAFSFGPDTQDEMRQRLEGAFDKFIDVRDKSDKEIAELARLMEIDIAIDLAGHTSDCRLGIFTFRAAPVQVNFLGYPGTSGAEYIDYLVADKTLIPEESRQHYSEKIIYLPDTYLVNDSRRKISGKVFSRDELGLPPSGFVFCCFNNNYKITPGTFAVWMRILMRVSGSVLWLSASNPTAREHLRKEAILRGVDARRLIFAEKIPFLSEHLARQRAADLFIDTFPYNAHTTASDALWAGLPVLTCPGEAFAGRVAASLLAAIDVPELIARTQEEYEDLAVELARNPERLKAIRKKIEDNRLCTPLFDTRLFTAHIEDAYGQMHERYQNDLPPEHIYVESRRRNSSAEK